MSSKVTHTQALGPTGLNLIRIAISAYFVAVALDWADGVDKGALFHSLNTPGIADFIGSMLLFYLAFVYMCGFQLRMSALFLAVFVLASAFVSTFVHQNGEDFGGSGLWRDLAFVCAILLSYASLSRRDLRRVAVLREKLQARKLPKNKIIQPARMPQRYPTQPGPVPTSAMGDIDPTAASAEPTAVRGEVLDRASDNLFSNV